MSKRVVFVMASMCALAALPAFLGGCTPAEETAEQADSGDYPIVPVPFTQVSIDDNFWQPRMETNRTVTIPFALNRCETTGRTDNLRKAAGLMEGPYEGRRFNDTDVYKVMEGAAYSLSNHPDPELEKTLDDLIEIIAGAQEEDGYLFAARTVDPEHPAPGAGPERWIHLQGSHELYNVGHFYESAIAHYYATGKRSMLDLAIKNADLVDSVFGPDKRLDAPGHQEVELGLVKLFRVTGNRAYLDLAKFFLDQRGQKHACEPYPEGSGFEIYNGREYRQDHIPVLEQTEAVGHAVRASYMYASMADIAALCQDQSYFEAIDRIWQNVVTCKLYLTGGIGARHTSEAFGDNYELPNRAAYTETCASVGNVFWNHRMFLLTGDAKYLDVMERTLYNGLISGVSLSGDRFFYQNPLESGGRYERSEWFEVSCCPGNIVRFLPSLPGYVYATKGDTLYVILYVANNGKVGVKGAPVALKQETTYPWDGDIKLTVTPETAGEFELALRIPGWVNGQPVPSDLYTYADATPGQVAISVNGEPITCTVEAGFARISRNWEPGDVVELSLPMQIREVLANENIEDDRGKVAFERGPIVFCAEAVDNGGKVLDLSVSEGVQMTDEFAPDLLGGVVMLKGEAQRDGKAVPFALIPYYAWAHRGLGEMAVWIPKK